MKSILILTLAFASTGCTITSLQRHTESQIQSATEYRYKATLHALAMVAANPCTLPSYAILSTGVAAVTDTGVANPVSTWAGVPEVFASETLGFTAAHSPMEQWTIDPVADYTQLEAMRCACRWVLAGQEQVDPNSVHILADPEADLSAGPHFGVARRLTRLPHGWLHVGRLRDVPLGAPYKDHCGDTWVWVAPDGTEGLADFTLVLQDIATLNVEPTDGTVPANLMPPSLVTLWVVQNNVQPARPVRIYIVKKNNQVVFRKEGGKPDTGDTEVWVGQSVVWMNLDDKKEHTATSMIDGLFDTKKIPANNRSQTVTFDQAMFVKAGGTPTTASVAIEYQSTEDPGNCAQKLGGLVFGTPGSKNEVKGRIILKSDPYTSLYSPTRVFRVDRVIKPEWKCTIENAIRNTGIGQQSTLPPVAIAWQQWMEMTTPYQSQRTSVKPGAATTTPVTRPQTRSLVPPSQATVIVAPFNRNQESVPPPQPENSP